MRIPHGLRAALASQGAAPPSGYQIQRSLRFNSADSAYLSRTPASAGNRKTWTWSGWVKRGNTAGGYIFGCDFVRNSTQSLYISFGDNISVLSWGLFLRTTTQVFRDYSAWYHLVVTVDTTDATANNRIRIYINGTEITTFSTLNNPTQNQDLGINQAAAHRIGDYGGGSYWDGYLADIHFIDGQALTPSDFTETDATTGQLIPKAYTGSYGTNGFHLPFSDNSTAAALGTDTSGNSNTWTVNNISVTAGAGNDSLVDTPTSYGTDTGAGGEVRGNYCTLNPLDTSANSTFSEGNLKVITGTSEYGLVRATIGVISGKWYWEVVQEASGTTNNTGAGIAKASATLSSYLGADAGGWGYYAGGNKITNNSQTAYGASWTNNDVIGIAFDADAGTLTFYKNGTTQGTAFTGLTSGPYFPALSDAANAYNTTIAINFGQRPFAYTAPSGFKALCDTNLPTPAIAKPNTVMDVKLYPGNGSTQTISGLGFSPDLVWIKRRDTTAQHVLTDIVRGADRQLFSSLTNAEQTSSTAITAFNSDGFSLGSNPSPTGDTNSSGGTYVAWTWDAGSSTVTNTQGSITSSVRANASAGFSIVSWNTPTNNPTVGHGLNVTPEFIITKSRTDTSAAGWAVYHKALGVNSWLELQATAAVQSVTGYWGTSAFSSTTFSVGLSGYYNNRANMIAYCFAPVAGYSSFGSYTGNGSTNGPFVYTGFRPRWILHKSTASESFSSWHIYDTARDRHNPVDLELYPNLSNVEGTIPGGDFDILSNGFKVRTNFGGGWNTNGISYIYAAFAEHPFQYARAR